MSGDDENRFEPRPGAIRSDSPKAGKAKSFLSRAKKLARQHSNRPVRGAARAPSSASRSASNSAGKGAKAAGRRAEGAGVRRGRGAAFVRARNLSGGWRHCTPGMRRVVVKTRYVRQAGRSGKGAAHLRYIQRDGTSRDGAPGRLYSATEDHADGEAFLARGRDDRHQFRFIIAPEDAAELSDLTGALLQKGGLRRDFPLPLPVQATRTISAVPRALKRLMRAMRMWISAVWRSGSLAAMRSPKALRQRILASARLRAWYPVHRVQNVRP